MPPLPPVNPLLCHCFALRRAARKITQVYESTIGLTASQFAILGVLAQAGPYQPTMGELAEAIGMDRSTLGHNLRPLTRDGLVTLATARKDRRTRRVSLTPLGNRRLIAARAKWKQAQALFESVYGQKRAGHLRAQLHDLAGRDFQTGSTAR